MMTILWLTAHALPTIALPTEKGGYLHSRTADVLCKNGWVFLQTHKLFPSKYFLYIYCMHFESTSSISCQLLTKFHMYYYITYQQNGRFTSRFHCLIRKSLNSLYSKLESHATSRLQTPHDETSTCKPPIIKHCDILSTTCTFAIDLSSATTMFAIAWVHMITLTSHIIYHITLKVKGYSYAKFY